MQTFSFASRQAERDALQAEIKETSQRLEQLFAYLQRLIERQVRNGSVQEV